MNKPMTAASIQMFVHKEKKKNVEEAEKHMDRINKPVSYTHLTLPTKA